jgi:nucleoside-diphosphate-sugar epimerase
MDDPSLQSLQDSPPPTSEEMLDEALSRPTPRVIEAMASMEGDLLVLGAGGKMGLSLARMARRAAQASGNDRTRIIAVSRFGEGTQAFDEADIETISVDLLDDGVLESLPDAANVLFLAGMKFGSSGAQPATWAMNAFLPGLVARRYRNSRMVALSTGNVYPFYPVSGSGAVETDPPSPVGEYAITCLGRERMLHYYSDRDGTPVSTIRLNYANALRYGVLVDIGEQVLTGGPVDVTMGSVNVIWQGDANAAILGAFGLCASPPHVLNVAGPEVRSVRAIAQRFAELLQVDAAVISGSESETALLSDSSEMVRRLGAPAMPFEQLLEWTAAWLRGGGALLGKATKFQVRDGAF